MYLLIMSRARFRVNPHSIVSCLNVKELLAWSRRKMRSLSDCSWTRTHNHLVRKRKLNHLVVGSSAVAVTYALTLFRIGLFGASHRWGVRQKGPLPKICHTYLTKMKPDTVIPYIKEIQNTCNSRDTSLDLAFFNRKSVTFIISRNTDTHCILQHNSQFF